MSESFLVVSMNLSDNFVKMKRRLKVSKKTMKLDGVVIFELDTDSQVLRVPDDRDPVDGNFNFANMTPNGLKAAASFLTEVSYFLAGDYSDNDVSNRYFESIEYKEHLNENEL